LYYISLFFSILWRAPVNFMRAIYRAMRGKRGIAPAGLIGKVGEKVPEELRGLAFFPGARLRFGIPCV
jgi:hypothetical protein